MHWVCGGNQKEGVLCGGRGVKTKKLLFVFQQRLSLSRRHEKAQDSL